MKLSWTAFLELDFSESLLVLTPNQRLSKFLHHQYQQHASCHQKAFYGGKIQSIEQYLHQSFIDLQFAQPETYGKLNLLDSHQELNLWLACIKGSKSAEALWFSENIGPQAMEAHQYTRLWGLPHALENFHYLGEDQKAFQEWQTDFTKLCDNNHHITSAELYELVSKAIDEKIIIGPKSLYCYGFDDFNPAQAYLLETLKSHTDVVQVAMPDIPAAYQGLLACENLNTELVRAGQWAKAVQRQDAQASIAIVVPSLNENRNLVDDIFTKILAPEHLNLQHEGKVKPYNISSGTALSRTPLVKNALLILELFNRSLQYEELEISKLNSLGKSPFIFNDSYGIEESLVFVSQLNKQKQRKVSKQELASILEKNINRSKETPCDFSKRLLVVLNTNQNLESKQNYTQWSQVFKNKLNDLAWLENFELNSENYQICIRFFENLEQLSRLDDCLPPCHSFDALQAFTRMLGAELFQVESINETANQINILGVLEAAAQDFSHLWLCEMHNENWPTKPNPNPFLSYSLQKIKQTPHASAERELRFSQQMTQRYLHHCQVFIASYGMNTSGQELKPSQLLSHIQEIDYSTLINDFKILEENSIAVTINGKGQCEYFSDNEKIPLDSRQAIKGGQAILKNHSQCPFVSFSANRLDLKPDARNQQGLSALDRGLILHRYMELLWKDLKNQKALKQLTENEITKKLNSIKSAVEKEYSLELKNFSKALAIECQRAMDVAKQLLDIEITREPFSVIGFETTQAITIEGMEINLRVDRIDQLSDESELIIDYKSSKSSCTNWLSPRMEEPQLPLYLMGNNNAIGVSFVTLNKLTSEQGFTGIAARPGIAPGIDDCHDDKKRRNKQFTLDWNKLKSDWESDLQSLTKDFIEGNARVDPKDIRKSCTYCDYSYMCRIQEISGVQYDDE